MAAETHSYTPQKLIAGEFPPIVTIPCTVKSGQNLAAYTLVEYDAAGKIITSGGSNKPDGVLASAVDASSGDTPGLLYKSCNVFSDQLVWHATQSTNLLKDKLVSGTMIVVTHQGTGEV